MSGWQFRERVVGLGLGGWEMLVSGGGKVGGGGEGEGKSRGYLEEGGGRLQRLTLLAWLRRLTPLLG